MKSIKLFKLKKSVILAIVLLILIPSKTTQGQIQVPVADYLGRWISKTTSVVSEVSNTINAIAEPLINTFEKAQDYFVKAETIINGSIKNMRAVQQIIQTEEAIFEYYQKSIEIINQPRDQDYDGIDDLDWLNKWKHLQILLGLFKESTNALNLFNNLLEEDAFAMDDKNRIQFLFTTLADLRKIKTAMRIEMRRINKEVFAFGRLKRERATFEKFFE